MTDLEKKAMELSEDFFELPVVKKFLIAKDEYIHSERLKTLRSNLLQAKKELNSLPFEKQGEGVRNINKLQKELDEDSLVITYNNLKDEVEELIVPIRDLF
jgi:cell fate (sporulation/competence/biofilm development) regulator YmcA (YheA/YmcA/DUF963 family)